MPQVAINAFASVRHGMARSCGVTGASRRRAAWLLICGIVAFFAASLHGQDIRFDKGSGAILEGSTSPDGMFAVVVTSNEEENVVVFLPERREVLKLSGAGIEEGSFPYFPGLNHGGLSVLWGPNQEGSSFGVLFYDAKWESAGVILIDVDPEFGRQVDIRPMLLRAAREKSGRDLSYTFSPGSLKVPAGELGIADPVNISIDYLGQSPGDEESPLKRGSLALRLTRTARGPEAALLGGAGSAPPAPVADPVPAADSHRALRDAINANIESAEFKKVRLTRPGENGRKISYRGYLQGNVLSKLMYVDSQDEANRTVVLYYWRDGQLVSVFEVRQGTDTQISEVAETVEIYNFENEKLVGWIRDGKAVDAGDVGFADAGATVLQQSVQRAEPIYLEIGAD